MLLMRLSGRDGWATVVLVVLLGSLSPFFRHTCLALPSPAIAELRPCTWALKRSGHLELVGFANALRGGGEGEGAPPGRTRGAASPAQHAEPSSATPGPSDTASGGGEINSEALERIRKSRFAPMTQPLDLSTLNVDGGLALEDVALAESALDAMYERRRCERLVETQIIFRDASAASAVSLVGSWTDWIEAHELAKVDDATWIIRLSLPLGEHLFKFVVDGRWTLSPDYSVMDDGDKSSGNNMILVSDVPDLEEFNRRIRSHEEESFFLDKDMKAAGAAHAEDMAIDAAINAALGTKSPTRRSNLPQGARASLTAGPHEQASTGSGQPDVFGTSGSLPLMSSPKQQKTPPSGAQCSMARSSVAIADELQDWALMMDGEVSRGGKESMSAARRLAAEEKDAAAAAARAAAARRVQDAMKKEAQKGARSPSKRREDSEKERLRREKMECERRREQRERARAQRERKRDNARTKAQKQKEELQKSQERQKDTERQRLDRDAARQKEADKELEQLALLEKAQAEKELEKAQAGKELEKARAEKELEKARAEKELEKAREEKELALLENARAERESALKEKAESEREPVLRKKADEACAASGQAVQIENVDVKANAANADLKRQNTHGHSDETDGSLDQAAGAAASCGEVDQQVVTTAPRVQAVLVSDGSESGQVAAFQAVGNGALAQEVPSTDTAESQAPAHASLSAHVTADRTSQLDPAGAEVPVKQADSPSAAARQEAASRPGLTASPLVDGCVEDAVCQSEGLVVERDKTAETVECCVTAWRTAMKDCREKMGAVRCRASRLGHELYEYSEGLLCQLAQSSREAISVHGGGNSNLVVACSNAGRKAVGVCREGGQEVWSSLGALRHKSVAFLRGQLPDSACLSLSVPATVARWRHEGLVRLAELVSTWQVILSEALGPSFQVNRAEAAVSLLGAGLLLLLAARVVLLLAARVVQVLVSSILLHDAHTSPAQGPAFSMLRSYSGRAQGKSSGQRLPVMGDSGSGHVTHPGNSGSHAARSGSRADVLEAPGMRAATAASVAAAEATKGTGGMPFTRAQGWFANADGEGRAEWGSVPGGADAGVRDSAAGRASQDERSEMGRAPGGTASANDEPSIMADLWAAMMHAQ